MTLSRKRIDSRPAGRVWTIVLAAGGSARLGRPKQLLRSRGMTLVSRVVALGENLTPGRVIVVVGAERLRIAHHLRQFRRVPVMAINKRWREGMSGSLAAGIARLPRNARAALILLTDQPGITRADLVRLMRRWQRQPGHPAAAVYDGRAGVPAIIPARVFRHLIARDGADTGARGVLRSARRLGRVAMPAAALDIDTAADLASLR